MSLADAIRLALSISILLLVFALGLAATPDQGTWLLRRPAKLARAVLSMYVIVPAFVALVAGAFNFPRPLEVALVAASLAPVPPILPGKQLKMGGRPEYVYGLLVAMSLLAIVFVPLAVRLVGTLFGRHVEIGTSEVARLVGLTVLLPLVAGMALHRFDASLARKMAPMASRLGTVLLGLALLPVLISSLPAMWQVVGNGTILLILGLVAAALATGHVLGGPDIHERVPLAIASAMRHPGIALAIARLEIQDDPLVPAAILVAVLVAAIATTVYGRAVSRRRDPSEAVDR